MVFQSRKTTFYSIIKKKSSKSRKIDIFPKGLVHCFVQKWPFFQLFFFQAIQVRKICFMVFQTQKNSFLFDKKKSFKSRNIDIFPKRLVHCFGQKWPFFNLFFLGNIGQDNVFYDILERKNNFLGYKNKKFKKSKNYQFFKGLDHGFGPKQPFFQLILFTPYRL